MKTEFTLQAKTVEEAYAKANDIYSSLGDISIEVINPGKKGFLGIGRVNAEIKVIVDDGKPERAPKPQKEQKPQKTQEQKQENNKNSSNLQKGENKLSSIFNYGKGNVYLVSTDTTHKSAIEAYRNCNQTLKRHKGVYLLWLRL